jgi:HrpA-like RNA helicase
LQIPQDEQGAAFEEPPSDTVHVILATNIAESSLTLPKVRIVIDYGIRKQLLYDTKCKMTVLRNAWISQASACQRKGTKQKQYLNV